MKKLNKQNGITLVALVITIIVMLILTTVTVNVVINGGLFDYAKGAKDSTEIASEKEAIQSAFLIAQGTSKTGKISEEELQKAVDKVINEGTATVIGEKNTNVVKFEESKRFYEIDNNGKIEGPLDIKEDTTPGYFDGTGTSEDPYVIMSIEDLVYFAQSVTNSNGYWGKYVVLGRNLDFESKLSYVDYTTTEFESWLGGDGTIGLMEQLSENGKGFLAIGKTGNASFRGIFDGNGYEIKNIYIGNGRYPMFFVSLSNAKVKNLTMSGKYISPINGGGLCGTIDKSTVFNCFIDIELNIRTAGAIACNCKNSKIINCYNNGNITGNWGWSAGGIVAYCEGTNYIYNCYNIGKVELITDNYSNSAGGIVGQVGSGTTNIINCYNMGSVTMGSSYTGTIKNNTESIVGLCKDGADVIAENCYYLEGTADSTIGTMVTENQIQNKETIEDKYIIDMLNEYVNNYNTENSTSENYIELKQWEIGKREYPTFKK